VLNVLHKFTFEIDINAAARGLTANWAKCRLD